jgi:xylulokinase
MDMEHLYLIATDVGTSNTKTVLWDETGKLVAAASQPCPLNRPDPLWAEISGGAWSNVCLRFWPIPFREQGG